MDDKALICWMVAHFSRQIQTIKMSMPNASREEIRFRLLDRWGLPIVPWVGNALSASLCKGPDHGIAMKFGLTESVGSESFDPVTCIDLDQCTITIDTVSTNTGMWNYESESWSSIRALLADVPLEHPLWRIDKSAGQSIWASSCDTTIAPVAPLLSFSAPLIDIKV